MALFTVVVHEVTAYSYDFEANTAKEANDIYIRTPNEHLPTPSVKSINGKVKYILNNETEEVTEADEL